ncbi:MAG: hypothetical protein Q4D24_10630 [Erysipelotrichaceae bacterium]|nr:hypothetical protein [Erysipelotrichaceae bacterium]
MKRILIIAALLIFISEGTGTALLKKLNIEKKGLAGALGFSVILGLLQTMYYVPLMLNMSFTWIIILTSLVLAGGLLVTLLHIKDTVRSFLSIDTMIIAVAAAVFMFVFSKMYIDLDYADSTTYLNYIALNINAPELNMYNLADGMRGQEWNVYYLFQGYYHFGSYLCWLVNLPYYLLGSSSYVSNLVVSVWGLGLLYNVFTNMLIVNAVKQMRTSNKFVRIAVLLFGLFYANFFYWNIAFAFYGNTFRSLFVMLLIYIVWRWQKDDDDNIKWLLWAPLAAGFACSSSFLFMSFAVMFALAGYLAAMKRPHALSDMAQLIMPMVCYILAFLSRVMPAAAIVLAVAYAAVFAFIRISPDHGFIRFLEGLYAKYAKNLFFIGVPVLFAIGSFVIHLVEKTDFTSYSYYLWNWRQMDMMTDYLFIHSEWLDGLVNVLRWAGVLLFIMNRNDIDEEKWMKAFVIMMVVFFLNPLCMILLQKTITGMVFYRNFMTLFNPLTEVLFLDMIFRKSSRYLAAAPVLSAFLVAAVLLGNIGSFKLDPSTGLYWVYIRGGQNVDGVYKVDPDEMNALNFLREEVKQINDRQPVVVSQSAATLTYMPEVYSIFGPWHYHYPLDRVNDEFYQITRKHEDWLEEEDPDYTKSCEYLLQYDTDYVLLQYWQSAELDQATDACSTAVYTGSKYKVKKISK